MYSLCFVNSPLQLKNCLRFCTKFDVPGIVVVAMYDNSATLKVYKSMLKIALGSNKDFLLFKLATRKVNKQTLYHKILNRLRIFVLAQYLGFRYRRGIDFLLVGDVRSFWMAICERRLSYRSKVIVDDGSASITLSKMFYLKGLSGPYEKFRTKELVILFSHFDIDYDREKFKFIKNDEYIKRKTPYCIDKKTAYFFGSNHVETGSLTLEQFYYFSDVVINYFRDQKLKVIYCPHRYEDPEKLERLSSNGWIVRLDIGPAEEFFARSSELPAVVGAINSTILTTLPSLVPDLKFICFKIPKEALVLRPGVEFHFDNYYEYLAVNKRMEVVDI